MIENKYIALTIYHKLCKVPLDSYHQSETIKTIRLLYITIVIQGEPMDRILTLYHGSERIIEKPLYGEGREQRNKDINRAQAESVYRLAKALGCHVEDLLEK